MGPAALSAPRTRSETGHGAVKGAPRALHRRPLSTEKYASGLKAKPFDFKMMRRSAHHSDHELGPTEASLRLQDRHTRLGYVLRFRLLGETLWPKRKSRTPCSSLCNPPPSWRQWWAPASSPAAEVVSKIWDYIKKNNLQNPANKREILADAQVEAGLRRQGQGQHVRDEQAPRQAPEVGNGIPAGSREKTGRQSLLAAIVCMKGGGPASAGPLIFGAYF